MITFTGLTLFICCVDEYEIEYVLRIADKTCAGDIFETIIIHPGFSTTEYIDYLNQLVFLYKRLKIRVVCQPEEGLDKAVRYAYLSAKGSHIIGTVADAQLDPYDIRKMIDLAKENGDRIITASRRLPMGSFGNYPKIKYVLNRLFNLSARLLLGSRQTDLSFPYQCIPTRYIQQHDFIKSCDAVMLELCFLPVLDGYDFCEIPSRLYDRKSGRSSSGFRYYLRYLHTYLCIVLTYYKNKRMKLK